MTRLNLPKNNNYVSRHYVETVLRSLNFILDVDGSTTAIFRQRKFPFNRITISKDDFISVELLRKLSDEIGISYQQFIPDKEENILL